jgi:hypothetical protein
VSRLRFGDYIKALYEHFPCKSQERFVLQLFSALCGDSDPIASNKKGPERYEYSPYLPESLRAIDGTRRKRLYSSHRMYKGLSGSIKAHLLEYQNADTFLAYCEGSVSVAESPKLSETFGVSDVTDRKALFFGLFTQFIEFAKSPDDDALCVVANGIAEYRESTQLFRVVTNEQSIELVIRDKFKAIVSEYDIIRYLNADPESNPYFEIANSDAVPNFKRKIDTEIIEQYVEHQDTTIYKSISRFAVRIMSYFRFIAERVSVDNDNMHFVLNHEEHKFTSLIEAVGRKRTGREEVRGISPQEASIFDGEGIKRVRELDTLYHGITGGHFLVGKAHGGWVDRDIADEREEKLIAELFGYTSVKATIPGQLLDVFRFAIDKCDIVRYMKCDPTYRVEFPVVRLDYFYHTMQELFDKYRHHQKEAIYTAIYRFSVMLQEYVAYLGCNLWPIYGKESVYVPYSGSGPRMSPQKEQEFETKIFEYKKMLDSLYSEVCDGETMFV